MDSILGTVKQAVGIESSVTAFDMELVMAINAALMILNQLGVGPTTIFTITDADDDWSDLLGDATDREAVKVYIYMKAKMFFDPPVTSFLIEAFERMIQEMEWRLVAQVEGEVEA